MKRFLLALTAIFISHIVLSQSVELDHSLTYKKDSILVSLYLTNNTGADFAIGNSSIVLGLDTNQVDVAGVVLKQAFYDGVVALTTVYEDLSISTVADTNGFSLDINLKAVATIPPSEALIADGGLVQVAELAFPYKQCIYSLTSAWYSDNTKNGAIGQWTAIDFAAPTSRSFVGGETVTPESYSSSLSAALDQIAVCEEGGNVIAEVIGDVSGSGVKYHFLVNGVEMTDQVYPNTSASLNVVPGDVVSVEVSRNSLCANTEVYNETILTTLEATSLVESAGGSCQPSLGFLTFNTTTFDGGTPTFTWYANDKTVAGQTSATFVSNFYTSTYHAKASYAGCEVFSDSVLRVVDKPLLANIINVPTNYVCSTEDSIPLLVVPAEGLAAEVDGQNGSYLALSNPTLFEFTTSESFSFEMSVKPQSISGDAVLAQASSTVDNWTLKLLASGLLELRYYDGASYHSITSVSTLATGAWSSLGFSVNHESDEINLYLNGVLEADFSTAGSDVDVASITSVLFGGEISGNSFEGAIDEVRLWDAALSSQTIAHVQGAELTGDEHGLLALWSMSEISTASSVTSAVNATDLLQVNGSVLPHVPGVGTSNASTYLWSELGGLSLANNQNDTLWVKQSGDYKITLTTANGCVYEDDAQVVINPALAIDLVSTTGNYFICPDETSISLSVQNAMPANPAFASYSWSTGATSASININAANKFSVEVTDANGCTGRDSVDVFIVDRFVTNLGADQAICEGDSIQIDFTGDSLVQNYLWSFSELSGAYSPSTDTSFYIADSGWYKLEVLDTLNCQYPVDSVQLSFRHIDKYNMPTKNYVCAGSKYNLNSQSFVTSNLPSNVWASVVWEDAFTGATQYAYNTGVYKAEVTLANGCTIPLEYEVGVHPTVTDTKISLTGVENGYRLSPFASLPFVPSSATQRSNDQFFLVNDVENTIYRYIPSSNSLIVWAGNGSAGETNGSRLSSSFNEISGLATNLRSNIMYVSERGNNQVRVVQSGGNTSSLLLNPLSGTPASLTESFVDGHVDSAKVYMPEDVYFDGLGNLYIADYGNNVIRVLNLRSQTLSTIGVASWSGVGVSTTTGFASATFNGPVSLAGDEYNNIYVGQKDGSVVKLNLTNQTVEPFSTLPINAPVNSLTASSQGVWAANNASLEVYALGLGSAQALQDVDGNNLTVPGLYDLFVSRNNELLASTTTGLVELYDSSFVDLCAGDDVTLNALYSTNGIVQWLNSANSVVGSADQLVVNSTDTYKLSRRDNATNCYSEDEVNVIVHDYPMPTLTPDSTICYEDTLVVFARSTGDQIRFSSNNPAYASVVSLDSVGVKVDSSKLGEFYFEIDNGYCVTYDTVKVRVTDLNAVLTVLDGTILPDTTCFGDSLLLSGLNSTGGRGKFTYEWASSDASGYLSSTTTREVKVLPSATGHNDYLLKVTDEVGCYQNVERKIFYNKRINASILTGDSAKMCVNPTSFVELNATGNGGKPYTSSYPEPYTYQWSFSDPSLILPSVGSDTTTSVFLITKGNSGQILDLYFEVKDSIGCFAIDTTFLTLDTFAVDLKPKFDPVCTNFEDSLLIDVIGGSGGYTVNWFSTQIGAQNKNNAIFEASLPGLYNVEVLVRDSLEKSTFPGCEQRVAVTIEVLDVNTQISDLSINILDDFSVCAGDTIALSGLQSVGLYGTELTYDWGKISGTTDDFISPADTLSDTVYIAGGVFNSYSQIELIATDSIGCKNADTISIYWNSPVAFALPDDTVFACENGVAILDAGVPSGGSVGTSTDYVFDWQILNPTETNAAFTSLSNERSNVLQLNDTYDTVVVGIMLSDQLACGFEDTLRVIGTDLNIAATKAAPVVCEGISNTLDVSVLSPGDEFGPYTYAWSQSGTSGTPSSNSSFDALLNTEGLYTYGVKVIDQTTGCTDSTSINFRVQNIDVNIQPSALTICYGDSASLLGENVTGGDNLSYAFTWSQSGLHSSVIEPSVNDTNVVAKHLAIDQRDTITYQLTVVDANGCTSSDQVELIWNSAVNVALAQDTAYSCQTIGAEVDATNLSGGTPVYAYEWFTREEGSLAQGVGQDTHNLVLADNVERMLFVSVEDAYGCTGLDSAFVIGIDFQVDASAKYDSICLGIADTLYATVVNDQIGNVSFLWSPATDIDDVTAAKPEVTPTVPVTYFVEAVDDKSLCTANASVSVGIYEINAVVNSLGDSISCYLDDPIALSGLNSYGGHPFASGNSYLYSWSADDVSLDLVDLNNGTASIDTGLVNRGASNWIYLNIEDALGCRSEDSLSIFWNPSIHLSIPTDTAFVCDNGQTLLNASPASGGTGTAYDYQWSSAFYNSFTGTSTLTPTISVNDGVTVFAYLEATDENDCATKDSVLVMGIGLEVQALAEHLDVCADLADTLDVSFIKDAYGPFTYSWTPAAMLDDAMLKRPEAKIDQATNFTVDVVDLRTNCTATSQVTIDVYEPTVTIETLINGITNVACDGSDQLFFKAEVSGVNNFNDYLWESSDANAQFSPSDSRFTEMSDQGLARPTKVWAIVTATDNIGCEAVDSLDTYWDDAIQVDFDYPWAPITIPGTGVEVTTICIGDTAGIKADVSRGIGPYEYQWRLDRNFADFEVSYLDSSEVQIIPKTAGVSTLLEVIVKDSVGCETAWESTNQISAQDLEVDLIAINADTVCPDTPVDLEATSTVQYNFGTAPSFSYQWTAGGAYLNSDTQSLIPQNAEGWYYVNALDNLTGCKARDSVKVVVSDLVIRLDVVSSNLFVPIANKTELCFGDQLTFDASATRGGKYPYTVEWTKNSSVVSNVAQATTSFQTSEIGLSNELIYTFTVVDLKGCTRDTTLLVSMNDELFADGSSLANQSRLPHTSYASVCVGDSLVLGGVTRSAWGGSGAYDYAWNNITANPNLTAVFGANNTEAGIANPKFYSNNNAGDYQIQLSVIDQAARHCVVTDVVDIEVKELPDANFTLGRDTVIACNGFENKLDPGDYAVYGVFPPDFQWYYNAAVVPNSTDQVSASKGGTREELEVDLEGWYAVHVLDRYTCFNADTGFVKQENLPEVQVVNLTPVLCNNAAVSLMAVSPNFNARTDHFAWEIEQGYGKIEVIRDSDDSLAIYVPSALDKQVVVKSTHINQCSDSTDHITFVLADAPVAQFEVSNQYLHMNADAVFTNTSLGSDLKYDWTIQTGATSWEDFDTRNLPGPVSFPEEGQFPAQLIVFDTLSSCTDTASIEMYVEVSHILYVPNVLYPQAQNEENKVVKIYGEGIEYNGFYFAIYNRWGDLIFETEDFAFANNNGWDGLNQNTGEVQEAGVFTYVLQGFYIDGKSFEKTGTITLIR